MPIFDRIIVSVALFFWNIWNRLHGARRPRLGKAGLP